jgi:hypothetical protein
LVAAPVLTYANSAPVLSYSSGLGAYHWDPYQVQNLVATQVPEMRDGGRFSLDVI